MGNLNKLLDPVRVVFGWNDRFSCFSFFGIIKAGTDCNNYWRSSYRVSLWNRDWEKMQLWEDFTCNNYCRGFILVYFLLLIKNHVTLDLAIYSR